MKIAIVGRPNVGKSTIFNRLVGHRKSIVHDMPGVTRDVIVEKIEFNNKILEVIDTGGLDYSETKTSELSRLAYEKAYEMMKGCDALLFVVDGKEGLHPLDEANFKNLRKLNLPTALLINKIDPSAKNRPVHEFHKLGIKLQVQVAAEHGLGFGDVEELLLDWQDEFDKDIEGSQTIKDIDLRLAIVGRPNVGKSSFVNAILGDNRLIVSDIQGTTRDAIDVIVEQDGNRFVLVDTAGLRKKSKIKDDVEFFSSVRTHRSIETANVVMLMIDANVNLTTQEAKIASEIISAGKGLFIFANKTDLCRDTQAFRKDFREEFYSRAPFLKFCEVYFGSVLHEKGIHKVLAAGKSLRSRFQPNITEENLKNVYQDILATNPPKGPKGFHLEFKRMSYQERKVPTFLIRCNRPQWVQDDLKRYFKNCLYKMFDFRGIPIQLIFHQNAVNSDSTERAEAEAEAESEKEKIQFLEEVEIPGAIESDGKEVG